MTGPFEAVILAGGQSSRMGCDKAWLLVGGQSLLARQVGVARQAGAVRVWISGRPGVDYSALDAPVILDAHPGLGPMSGVRAAMQVMAFETVLVLAVDLPHLTADFVGRLRGLCPEGRGVVPVVQGRLEPLVAFYPRSAARLLEEEWAAGRLAMRGWVRRAADLGLIHIAEVGPEDGPLFVNWNTPEDRTASLSRGLSDPGEG